MMVMQSRQTVALIGLFLLKTALLVASCDTAGTIEDETDEVWSATSTLDGRITNYEESSPSGTAVSTANQAPGFVIKSRVAPPDVNGDGTPERATHLSVSPAYDKLYVGYETLGSSFGGGVDVVDIRGSFADGSVALQTDVLDVQALAVHDNDEALFVGTSLAGAYSSASQFHSLNLTSGGTPINSIEYDEAELPGRLVNSVVAAPNSSTYDAFAVSDANSVHGIETTGSGWTIGNVTTEKRGSSSGLRFQSVTTTRSGTAYALSDGGHLYTFSGGLPRVTSSSLGALDSDAGTVPLSAHAVDASGDGSADSEFLFVALNEGGVRVVDPSSGEVVFSDSEVHATSVTATADFVYVATGDGLAVYEVGSGLGNTDPTDGLTDLGHTPIGEFVVPGGTVPAPTGAAVNHVISHGGYLYLAKGTDGAYKVKPQDPAARSAWSSSNTLSGRITNYGGKSSSAAAASSTTQTPSFEIRSRVAPPDVNSDGTPERASYLSVSPATDKLYVGYKIAGAPYGGGVDILDISGPFTDGSDALQTDQLDVQAVAVRDNAKALFVGAAVAPGNLGSASQLHSINLDASSGDPVSPGDIEYDATQLPGTLVKSVVAGSNNSTYDAFAVSDANSFHGIETTGTDWEIDNVATEKRVSPSALRFRSVTVTRSGTAYALSDGGYLYEFSPGLPRLTNSSLGSPDSDASIARLSVHFVDASGDGSADSEFLFVSLNEKGFRVVAPSSGEVVFSDPALFATSVTATADFVYVATGDGLAVYEVGSGLGNTDPADGLNDLGRTSLSEFAIQGGSVPTPTDAQVNHVVYDGGYLYVAKSTDGVYKIEQNN